MVNNPLNTINLHSFIIPITLIFFYIRPLLKSFLYNLISAYCYSYIFSTKQFRALTKTIS